MGRDITLLSIACVMVTFWAVLVLIWVFTLFPKRRLGFNTEIDRQTKLYLFLVWFTTPVVTFLQLSRIFIQALGNLFKFGLLLLGLSLVLVFLPLVLILSFVGRRFPRLSTFGQFGTLLLRATLDFYDNLYNLYQYLKEWFQSFYIVG